MSNEDKITDLWKDWKSCKAFMEKKSLFDTIEKCIDFYEGRHWGEISNKTKNMPRVTINQIEMIVNSKTSGILVPIRTTFYSDENPQKAEEITKFNRYIEKEMKFDELCAEAVEEGAVIGCKPVHFYWDEDACGKRGEYKGGLRAELIDTLKFGVHNPLELDIQKQKWIIISSRIEVSEAKKLCSKEEDKILIIADDKEDSKKFDEEQDGTELCTILTKYYRKNGEVYYDKATKNVTLCEGIPINPELVKISDDKEDEEIDGAVNNLNAEEPKQDNKEQKCEYKATLYPIALYVYKKRKGSIYGRGEVEPLIMNNKAVNFSYSMMAKSIEDIGFGTLVAKEGALDNQRISNDPQKILIDKYKGAGYGIYALNKQPFQAQVPSAISSIMDSTRSVTGATEVMTGEIQGANQSGTSIAYLQQQAQKPLNKLVERYKAFRVACAEIMMQFYILCYKDKPYSYEKEDVALNDISAEDKQQLLLEGQNVINGLNSNVNMDTFNGLNYQDTDFTITCEAGTGSQWSELSELQMLEFALTNKQIDFKTFLKAYPNHLITNKDTLLNGIEETENGVIAQKDAEIMQLKQQIAQCQAYIKQSEDLVNKTSDIVKRNRELQKYFADLQTEYANKINIQNSELATMKQDATDMATQIAMQNPQIMKQ